jgi:hypothetical protein
MRHNEKYSCVHETIDEITTDNECMKFFLAPIEYDKKENVDVKWILTTGGEGVPELAKIPEYKEILKKYLVDNKYLSAKTRNNIVSVL